MSRAQQIEERAALWVLQRDEPSWSPAEQAEFDEWLAQSDAHRVAFWRLEFGWREADRIASLGTPPPASAHHFDRSEWWRPLAVAASLVLVFTFFLMQWPNLPNGGIPATRIETSIGGHKVLNLPDGSRVELNTDTAIKATVDDRRRAVWLERGEAFFDVAKRQGREFVIYAGTRTITVLGTKFSVRRTPREMVVAVLEGRVRVDDAPDRHATVRAGDVAIASGQSTLVTNSAEAVQQQLAWRDGLLMFDGATLATAAEQFNRYNRKQIVIGDADAARIVVGGSFLARNVDGFVSLLEEAYGLKVRGGAGTIILSSRRMASRGPLKPLRPNLALPRAGAVQDARRECGADSAGCALIQQSPPARQVQVASAPTGKALRNAKNWDVLHKLYPPRALAAGEEGLVGFTVRIDSSGSPTACKITHTSGHPLLDLETCQLIMMHATFTRPAGASPSQQRSYEGVVNWRLQTTAQSAVPSPPKAIAQAAAPEELICKRIPKTGSNAAFERKCMTKSDWQRASSESRNSWDQLPSRGGACEGYPPRCR